MIHENTYPIKPWNIRNENLTRSSLSKAQIQFIREKTGISFIFLPSYRSFINVLDYNLPGAFIIQIDDEHTTRKMTNFLTKCGYEPGQVLELSSLVLVHAATCWIIPPSSFCVEKILHLLNSLCQCQKCRDLSQNWRRSKKIVALRRSEKALRSMSNKHSLPQSEHFTQK